MNKMRIAGWQEETPMAQQVINLPGLEHPQASPVACRIGPLLTSGAIVGKNPETGVLPESAEAQARNAFANMERVLKAAGMSLGDVAKLTIYVADEKYRDTAIRYWAQHFPDPNHRPARRTLQAPIHAGVVQLEVIAYKAP
jgi:2-iminobutanoate/2-iminopropanoate deaminase